MIIPARVIAGVVSVGGQDLDRDVAPELLVARAIHLAHPTLTEFGDDLVGAEVVSSGKRQEVFLI